MGRKRHAPEAIIGKLREAEVGLAKGQTIPQGYRTLGPIAQIARRCGTSLDDRNGQRLFHGPQWERWRGVRAKMELYKDITWKEPAKGVNAPGVRQAGEHPICQASPGRLLLCRTAMPRAKEIRRSC